MQVTRRMKVMIGAGAAALFIAGFLAGSRYGDILSGTRQAPGTGFEIREPGYSFINPLLECELGPETVGHRELTMFHDKVYELIRREVNGGTIQHVSVYFRDLNNGPSFGIAEEEEYSPASLLKVVIMIAALKKAEHEPRFLQEKILFPSGASDENVFESIKPTIAILPGHSYTIDELIAMMVEHSDNNAMQLLLAKIDPRMLGKTYEDLGFAMPETTYKLENFMSVRMYASCFRVLFNASYLTREMSIKALEYLSKVEFRQGIVGGLPPGITVAHKFGERGLGKQKEIKQLHDCGIVYYPGRPYLLCIMSRGSSYEYLDDVIRDISSLVFQEVDRQR